MEPENTNAKLTVDQRQYRAQLVEHMANARRIVYETLKAESQKSREKANTTRKDQQLMLGDIVMWKAGTKPKDVPQKWWHPWMGPFRVIKNTGPVNYQIEHLLAPGIKKIAHMERLKRHDPRSQFTEDNGETIQGLSLQVLDTRVVNNTRQFQVRMRVNGKSTVKWINPSDIQYDEQELRRLLADELHQRVTRLHGVHNVDEDQVPNQNQVEDQNHP
jgi:hypothetical protein